MNKATDSLPQCDVVDFMGATPEKRKQMHDEFLPRMPAWWDAVHGVDEHELRYGYQRKLPSETRKP